MSANAEKSRAEQSDQHIKAEFASPQLSNDFCDQVQSELDTSKAEKELLHAALEMFPADKYDQAQAQNRTKTAREIELEEQLASYRQAAEDGLSVSSSSSNRLRPTAIPQFV